MVPMAWSSDGATIWSRHERILSQAILLWPYVFPGWKTPTNILSIGKSGPIPPPLLLASTLGHYSLLVPNTKTSTSPTHMFPHLLISYQNLAYETNHIHMVNYRNPGTYFPQYCHQFLRKKRKKEKKRNKKCQCAYFISSHNFYSLDYNWYVLCK